MKRIAFRIGDSVFAKLGLEIAGQCFVLPQHQMSAVVKLIVKQLHNFGLQAAVEIDQHIAAKEQIYLVSKSRLIAHQVMPDELRLF